MGSKYIIALDQGTTSSRAVLFDEAGKIQGIKQKEFTQIFPKPGWVEHDPDEIWRSQLEVLNGLISDHHVSASEIAALGITNQRETGQTRNSPNRRRPNPKSLCSVYASVLAPSRC